MKYKFRDVLNAFPKEKRKGDSFFIGRFISRPISFVLTFLAANIGLSAWFVSILSAVCALSGCILFAFDNNVLSWIGVGLVILWSILDCVDGNVARLTKTQSKYGEFMDAESGYIICAFVYIAIGIKSSYDVTLFKDSPLLLIVFGSVASICDCLSRLINQKFLNSQSPVVLQNSNPSFFSKIRKIASIEIGPSGLVILFLILGLIFPIILEIASVFYFCFCLFSFLIVSVFFTLKARRNS